MLAMPLPNVPGSDRLYVNRDDALRQDNQNGSLRLDLNVASGQTLFGRVSAAREDASIPEPVPGRMNVNNGRPLHVVVGATNILGPRAVNEFRVGRSHLRLTSGLPELTFQGAGQDGVLPRFLVAGYPVMGGTGGFTGTTGGGISSVDNGILQMHDNLSWLLGRHQLKIGGEFLWVSYNRLESPNATGTFQFTQGITSRTAANDGTGSSLATFLLGLPSQGNRTVGPSQMEGRQWSVAGYVQDDIRLTDRLTINAGVRYEISPPMYDRGGRMSSVDYRGVSTPTEIFAAGTMGQERPTLFVCGQAGYPKGCAYTDRNNLAPRLGAIYRADDRTVIRAGAGVYYGAQDANPLFRLAAGLPTNIAQTIAGNNFVPSFNSLDIFGPPIVGPVEIQQAGIDLFQRTPYTTQWSVSSQRQVGRSLALEIGYNGNRGLKLEQNVQPNNAQPGAGAVAPRRPYRFLQFAEGTTFPDYLTVAGNSVPVGFINYYARSASADYHAGFVRVEKRMGQGLALLSSYTFSHAMTTAPQFRNAGGANGAENSPPQDSHNLAAERGLAAYHSPHRWVSSVVYDLPFGADGRWARDGVGAAVLGNWQIAGIYTLQSGFPFTVNLRGDTAGIGGGTGGILVRPNAVPGVDPVLPPSQRGGGMYLNTQAFTAPPAFTFGNVGRNTVIGPGYANLDLALIRTVGFGGTRRLHLRAEAFNAFNRRNYVIVGRILNDPTFGRLLSQTSPRQLQFGARLEF